jgi:hypothetical protein
MATLLAVRRVQPVFRQVGLDLRQVHHLMAERIGIVDEQERRPALLALVRKVVLDLGHLLRWQHLSLLRLVPGLPATLRPLGGDFSRSHRWSALSFDGGWFEFDEF